MKFLKNVFKAFAPILFLGSYVAVNFFEIKMTNGLVTSGAEINAFNMTVSLLINGAYLGILWFAACMLDKRNERKERVSLSPKLALVIILAFPGLRLIMDRLIFLLNDVLKLEYSLEVSEYTGSVLSFIVTSAYAVLFSAPIEELIFRKLTIDIYQSVGGKIYGIVVGTLLFSWPHTSKSQFTTLFVGLIMALIYCYGRNIKINIMIHMLANLFPTIMFLFAPKNSDGTVIGFHGALVHTNWTIFAVFVSISAITVILSFALRKRNVK